MSRAHWTLLDAVLLASLVLAFRADEELAPPAPAVAIRTDGEPPKAEACAECHGELVREWSASAHGLAWIDHEYQRSLRKKKRRKLCHGCHVPQPLLAGGELTEKPEARDDGREQGVSCEACHLGPGGAMLGPRGTPTDAHASLASPAMTGEGSNALCAACHGRTVGPVIGLVEDFERSAEAARGGSCVACHMAPVERRFAAGGGVPIRAGRSHALQTPRDPRFLRRAFALRLEPADEGVRLVVTNAAGHRVPGLVGRELELEATLLDAAGVALGEASLRLDVKAYLPVDAERALELGPGGGRVRVVGRHTDPRSKEAIVFLEETLEL